jgi:hypothetical protein
MAEELLTEQIFRAKFDDQVTGPAQEAVDKARKMFEDLASSMKAEINSVRGGAEGGPKLSGTFRAEVTPGAATTASASIGMTDDFRISMIYLGKALLGIVQLLRKAEGKKKPEEEGGTLAEKTRRWAGFKELARSFKDEMHKNFSLIKGFLVGTILGPAIEEFFAFLEPVITPFIEMFRSLIRHPEVRKFLDWITIKSQEAARSLTRVFGLWIEKHVPRITKWLQAELPRWWDEFIARWKIRGKEILDWISNFYERWIKPVVKAFQDMSKVQIGGQSLAAWIFDIGIALFIIGQLFGWMLPLVMMLGSGLGWLFRSALIPLVRFLFLTPWGLLIAGLLALGWAIHKLVPGEDFLVKLKNAGLIIWDYWSWLFTNLGGFIAHWAKGLWGRITGRGGETGEYKWTKREWEHLPIEKKGGGLTAEGAAAAIPIEPTLEGMAPEWLKGMLPGATPSVSGAEGSSAGRVEDLLLNINNTLKGGFTDTADALVGGGKDLDFGMDLDWNPA